MSTDPGDARTTLPIRRPRPGEPGRCGRRVLVVDDYADAANSLAVLVRLWGHQVQTAHDGPGALAAAERFRPDVVLLDIGLPGMDGCEVARQLRQAGRPVLLVAVTGLGREDDRRRYEAAGIDVCLIKPADPGELRLLLAGP